MTSYKKINKFTVISDYTSDLNEYLTAVIPDIKKVAKLEKMEIGYSTQIFFKLFKTCENGVCIESIDDVLKPLNDIDKYALSNAKFAKSFKFAYDFCFGENQLCIKVEPIDLVVENIKGNHTFEECRYEL